MSGCQVTSVGVSSEERLASHRALWGSQLFPLAPQRPSFMERLRLRLLGFRDRKKYQQLLDGTATHAIIHIRSLAQAGQHSVNKDYLEEASRLSSAVAVTEERILTTKGQIEDSKSLLKSLDGRRREKEAEQLSTLQKTLSDLKNQLASNEKRMETLAVQAQQAMDSWNTYYQLLASVYVRQRLRLKRGVTPAAAELPAYEAIRLTGIEKSKKEAGVRRAS